MPNKITKQIKFGKPSVEFREPISILKKIGNTFVELAVIDKDKKVIFQSPEVFLKTYREVKNKIKKYLKENK